MESRIRAAVGWRRAHPDSLTAVALLGAVAVGVARGTDSGANAVAALDRRQVIAGARRAAGAAVGNLGAEVVLPRRVLWRTLAAVHAVRAQEIGRGAGGRIGSDAVALSAAAATCHSSGK